MRLFDRELLVVGGKGGTGKSLVAAALAELSAFRGARTLLVAADGTAGAAAMFGVDPEYRPREVGRNLSVLRIDTRASLDEFVGLQLGPLRGVSGPVSAALRFVADAAPGVSEVLLVGKYAYEARQGDWDLVVVDGASTGHLIGELAAPAAIAELAPIGRLARETGWIVDLLGDPDRTGVVNVTLAEEIPVAETLEFVSRLHGETPAKLAAVVVNRTRPQLYARTQRAELEEYLDSPPKRLTVGARHLLEGVRIGLERADVSSVVDARLQEELPADIPVLHVPEFPVTAAHSGSLLAEVREALADEMSL